MADGWSRGEDGLLHKKYDPHAARRAAQYEESLRLHQERRRHGPAPAYTTNRASEARSLAAREKAAAVREEKVARARKFNHRATEKYMDDFHAAFGLEAREAPTAHFAEAVRLTEPRTWSGGSSDWRAGPRDPSGRLIDASDRPLLCVSVSGEEVVVGSADHACYAFKGQSKRQLYSKTQGHAEWVTGVIHFQNDVLSAGMDGKLCRWKGRRCDELLACGASLSVLLVDRREPVALSADYEGVARLWRLTDNVEVAQLANAQRGRTAAAPILCACWHDHHVLCGDRDGRATLYRADTASVDGVFEQSSNAHVTAVAALDETFVTGAADGHLRMWDSRTTRRSTGVHRAEGPINGLCGFEEDANLLASIDRHVKVFDRRSFDSPVCDFAHHDDVPLCVTTLGPHIVSGAANGALLCHDAKRNDCCWGLGANKGAVRAIDASPERLVAVGDDGNCLVWSF